jgi:hypothetical protein
LAHLAYVESTEEQISREAARAFADGVRERQRGREIRRQLLLAHRKKTLIEALNDALVLEAADMRTGTCYMARSRCLGRSGGAQWYEETPSVADPSRISGSMFDPNIQNRLTEPPNTCCHSRLPTIVSLHSQMS